MDLTLNETEVKQAIVDYIKTQGISTSGCSIDVSLKASRITAGNKTGGTTATISINKSINTVESTNVETVGMTDTSEEEVITDNEQPVLSANALSDKVEAEETAEAESESSLFSDAK